MNFNEVRQSSPEELPERKGSDQDAQSLKKTFEGFGFLCNIEKNKKGRVCLRFVTHIETKLLGHFIVSLFFFLAICFLAHLETF